MKRNFWMTMAATATAVFILAGCDKNDPASSNENSTMATEDAAESIASAVGSDNGGAMDQLADVAELASIAGIQGQDGAALGKRNEAADVDTSYDPGTGTWTVIISRERGNPDGPYYAAFSRTYTYQFLNKDGQPQKYWRVRNGGQVDTAYTIKFNIVEGTGTHRTPRLSQQLTDLSGAFTATGTNTPLITVNGTYSRSAVDTITTRNAVRTLDYTLSLNFIDIKIPRGTRSIYASQITGTITGNYTATATFQRGSLYSEKNIDRDFTITLGGGNARIRINGLDFVGDLLRGELR
ncbi:MAG: hypothetical protein ACREOO_14650 [bacterium]